MTTVVQIGGGHAPIYAGVHCKENMKDRNITITEMETSADGGNIVFERPGVSKIVGPNLHIVFANKSRKIYTVYRPYVYDGRGKIYSQTDQKIGGHIFHTDDMGDFYMSAHTERVTTVKRGISIGDVEQLIKHGKVRRERHGVNAIMYLDLEAIYQIDTKRIFTVHKLDGVKHTPKHITPLPYGKHVQVSKLDVKEEVPMFVVSKN